MTAEIEPGTQAALLCAQGANLVGVYTSRAEAWRVFSEMRSGSLVPASHDKRRWAVFA